MRRRYEASQVIDDPLWYKDATIYELHVRSFFDSNGDGIGDFPGLTQKLDYLKELGVNTLWLLPFYPSPLKDDGYDIADYYHIHPSYGRMSDFEEFLTEAHHRGLRVITELVINHTSDQHPWFQKARCSPPGSSARDFYVWSNDRDKYKGVRIIFKDSEYSNWAWDEVSNAYYWHRFYSHQPDLNFDNSEVHEAIFKVVDFWLGIGVDGLRVDAVPYLYEREGTSCENLPETHVYLKQLRAHIDSKFKNRVLLAEANQWPEDAVPYFGNGDEFNMAFHFPIMPRLFMATGMEDRFPIIDILRQTPPIPQNSQWGIFLRNHDELTLEMVTDEERDYMYRVYANDPTSRLNLGIRRRLAPLLNNDRRKLEMMNALLFSLPGTPVVYYGDEIGMGDNIYLGDRNGVRTPMQWSADRNAGFSRANPQKLYLPAITDPGYHYEAVNVETQQTNSDSLLSWMKRIIALNKRYKAFGRGSIEFLQPENHKVLVFLRRYRDEVILVMVNLSHLSQQTQLDLKEFARYRLINLFGPVEFTPISESKYPFTLSPYAFYWFSIQPQIEVKVQTKPLPVEEVASIPTIAGAADDLFDYDLSPMEAILQSYIKGRRWFRSKARDIQFSRIRDVIPVRSSECSGYFVIIRIVYVEGETETYVVPLSVVSADRIKAIRSQNPQAIVARLKPPTGSKEAMLCDGMMDENFCRFVLKSMSKRRHFKGKSGQIVTTSTNVLAKTLNDEELILEPQPVSVEQTNTSVVYGDKLILKLFRQLGEGVNPELEIGRFLTEKTSFTNVAPLAGALEYFPADGEPITLAVLQGFVLNEGDAWKYTQDSLEQFFENVLTRSGTTEPGLPQNMGLVSLTREITPHARESIGAYLVSIELLGKRTAELHKALTSVTDEPDFAPEPFSFVYQNSLYQSMRVLTVRTMQMLRQQINNVPPEARDNAVKVTGLENAIIERFRSIQNKSVSAVRARYHGDYHLGQVLYTGKDFVIIDFEGETARPLTERRLKRSPLRDVAGMIRSFNYAAYNAVMHQVSLAPQTAEELKVIQIWAKYWYTWVSAAFLKTYLDNMKEAQLLPADQGQLQILLDAFLLEKAIYEIGYELNNRPAWINVPLQGVLQLMAV